MNGLRSSVAGVERQSLRYGTTFQIVGRISHSPQYRFTSSSSTSTGAGPSRPKSRKVYYLLAIPLAFLPFTLFGKSRKPLDPYTYSDHHTVQSNTRLTARHAHLAIPLSPTDAAQFRPPGDKGVEGTDKADEVVVIQHLMVKNPDIQIERPYTPINDVGKDGEIELVVKRVKGGEVGR